MAKYMVNDTSLTAVADAIRTKGGTSEALSFPDGFVSAVEGIQAGGGGDEIVSGIISGSIESITIDNEVTTIRPYVFCKLEKLYSVVLPTTITTLPDYAFDGCKSLSIVNVEKLVTIGKNAFGGCPVIAQNYPELKTAGSNSLTGVKAPYISFPKLTKLDTQIFGWNHNVIVLDFGSATSIRQHAFYECLNLEVVILRSETLCILENTGAFNYTKFATNGTGGTVYVPSALIAQYQQATNWSTLYTDGTCNFVAIEGSEYE